MVGTLRTAFCLLLIGLSQSGCGKSGEVGRLVISGEVTFDGKPVPSGAIWMEPDASVGLMAPTGFAQIRDGRFQTQPDRSPIAGRHTLRVSGYASGGGASDLGPDEDAPPVEPLFPEYLTVVELPPAEGTLKLEVPAQ